MRQIIDSTQINAWFISGRRDAQELLPHLVRRLMLATADFGSFDEFQVGVGDEITRPGYDGRLRFRGTHPFIPGGDSVWEMGTGDPKAKADDDYKKRSESIDPNEARETSFVFVTPHRWDGKDVWLSGRKAEQVWKDVRVLDDADLATWLEIAPGVSRWLASQMGVNVEHVKDADLFWREIAALYGVDVPAELVIGGRRSEAAAVQKWLESDASTLIVEGESVEEASCFVAACISTLPEPTQGYCRSRLLFVDAPAGLDVISLHPAGLFLVPTTDETRIRAKAIQSSKVRLLLPRGRLASRAASEIASVKLGLMQRQAADEAVIKLVSSPQTARRIVVKSRGSFEALLWMLAQDLEHPPVWTQPQHGRQLVPLMLAGRWAPDQKGDREVLEKLSGREYDEVENMTTALGPPAGPMVKRGSTWDWRGSEYAWRSLIEYVDTEQLNRFFTVAVEVLSARDPRLELEPDQRWAASLWGKDHPYSSFLRSGLVESVARLAISAEGHVGQFLADNLVRAVLVDNGTSLFERFWSLSNFLPDLAEASPASFLAALETLCHQEDQGKRLFTDHGPMSWSPHVYLLWALERLAWSTQIFTRVVLLLGRLASFDPGGNTSNRPARSLTEVFLPWLPRTCAAVQHRLDTIDRLYERYPDVAWKLLVSLLPGGVEIVSPTAEPQWRGWRPDGPVKIPAHEYWEFVERVVDRMIEWASRDGERWVAIAKAYSSLAKSAAPIAEKIITAMGGPDPMSFTKADRAVFAEGLRSLAARHREYPDIEWALPRQQIALIEQAYERMKPDDPAERHLWLFAGWPTLPDEEGLDFAQREARLREHRRAAIEQILQFGGLHAALAFAERVEVPGAVGQALAELSVDNATEASLLNAALSAEPDPVAVPKLLQVGLGYVGERHGAEGASWLQSLRSNPAIAWDANRFANLAWGLTPNSHTWDFIANCGPEADKLYWQRVPVHYLPQQGEDLKRAARRLLEAGRPARVIFVVGLSLRRGEIKPGETAIPVDREIVVQALRDVLRLDREQEWYAPAVSSLAHEVGELLDGLESDGADTKTLAELEWPWLAALEHTRRGPRALEKALSESPEFFVDVLAAVFRAKGEERSNDEAKQAVASQAYRLLERWHRVPGLVETQTGVPPVDRAEPAPTATVDQQTLLTWILKARELAAAKGRLEVCDSRIGNILAYSPADPDGSWPCEGVREVIERVHTEELDRGVEIGVFNRRGAHFRQVGSGGDQERALSETYRRHAQKSEIGWPCTAAILRSIADSFERHAKREDEEAKLEEYE